MTELNMTPKRIAALAIVQRLDGIVDQTAWGGLLRDEVFEGEKGALTRQWSQASARLAGKYAKPLIEAGYLKSRIRHNRTEFVLTTKGDALLAKRGP